MAEITGCQQAGLTLTPRQLALALVVSIGGGCLAGLLGLGGGLIMAPLLLGAGLLMHCSAPARLLILNSKMRS